MKQIILLSSMVLWALAFKACGGEEEKDVIYPDAKIIKALPIMYGALLNNGETALIQTEKELRSLFKNNIPEHIKKMEINFDKYSLITGTKSHIRGVSKLEHSFKKTQNKEYEYLLTVIYDGTLPVGMFSFGILIEKIPSSSDIKLKIIDSNSY